MSDGVPIDGELAAAIVAQVSDALVFADREGVVRVWNAVAEALFGFGADEALGASLDFVIPERLRAAHWAGFFRAMETGTMRLAGRPTITRATHKSGRRLYVEMSFSLVRGADGTPIGSVAVARDATQRYEEQRARERG
jgi:PAS domain S-box-containing protein